MGVGKMAGRQNVECWRSLLRLVRAALGLGLLLDLLLPGDTLLGTRLAGQGYRIRLGLNAGADPASVDFGEFRAQEDDLRRVVAVSYTHLDVYKRQTIGYEIPLFLLREPSTLLEKSLIAEARACKRGYNKNAALERRRV